MKSKPLIIAHRGASAFAPENTFAAFRRAIAGGADGIEFDVRLAKDNAPVVIHDATLLRLANIDALVSDLTSGELGQTDVGSWFNKKNTDKRSDKFSAETVPTLERLFDFLIDYKGLIYVELKDDYEVLRLAESVCGLIRQTNLLPQIVVKSFNLEAVSIVKHILPEVRTAALFEPTLRTFLQKKHRFLDAAQACRADEISIHYSLATKNFTSRAAERNMATVVWTTDNPAWIRRALNYGIKAIITNNPAHLLAKRGEIAPGDSISV